MGERLSVAAAQESVSPLGYCPAQGLGDDAADVAAGRSGRRSALYRLSFFGTNLIQFATWLVRNEGAVVFLAVLAPLIRTLARGITARSALPIGAFAAIVCGSYLFLFYGSCCRRFLFSSRVRPAVLLAFQPSIADACQLTIPQLIELRRPEPVEIYETAELVGGIPFEATLAKAELIVEGRVRPLKTYLGEDKCYLYTDFELVAPLVIVGNLAPAKTPGPQPSLVVRQMGGTLVIDGVKVIVENQQLPPFRDGQRVVLLLSRLADGRYEIAGHAFGAFIAEADGKIRPVLRGIKGIYDDMQSLTRAEFVERAKKAGR